MSAVNQRVGLPGTGASSTLALLGDPVLRLQTFSPPSGLTGNDGTSVVLNWIASPEPGAQYLVYRSTTGPDGPFMKLTAQPIGATTWTDPAPAGPKTYQVRAVGLVTTGSGSFFNNSQGIFKSVN